jgi:hypothetical protein
MALRRGACRLRRASSNKPGLAKKLPADIRPSATTGDASLKFSFELLHQYQVFKA